MSSPVLAAKAVVAAALGEKKPVSGCSRYQDGTGDSFVEASLKEIQMFDVNGVRVPQGEISIRSTSGHNYGPVKGGGAADLVEQKYSGGLTTFQGSGDPLNPFTGAMKLLRAENPADYQPQGVGADRSPFTSTLRLGEDTWKIKGSFDAAGGSHFPPTGASTKRLKRADGSEVDLQLTLDRAIEPPRISGTVRSLDGARSATIDLDLAQYTKNPDDPLAFPFVPPERLGTYTIAFPAVSAPNRSLAANQFPQGAGVGTLTVLPGGVVRMAGKLADGAPVTVESLITTGGKAWLFAPLYDGKGSLSGQVTFADNPDIASPKLIWFRPKKNAVSAYRDGWPGGIDVTAVGSKYTLPPEVPAESVFPGLGPADADGNLLIHLRGGQLPDSNPADSDPATPFTRAGSLNPKNKFTIVGTNDLGLELTVDPITGMMSGAFAHPAGGGRPTFRAVILQKAQEAVGYFLHDGESGAVSATQPP